ncbi:MAG: glycosyltransferase family 39 protein [Chloroflexota bacterium]
MQHAKINIPPVRYRTILILAGLTAALVLSRLAFPERGMDYKGPRAVLDAAFAVWLTLAILFIAASVGRKVLRRLKVELSQLETYIFGTALGLGITAYGVLALGLTHLLTPTAVILWVSASGLLGLSEWANIVQDGSQGLTRACAGWKTSSKVPKIIAVIVLMIAGLSILNALAPPWAYDALMYHLQGPRIFLENQAILLDPEFWETAFPFTIEMLFTIGVALQSDTSSSLIHLLYGALLVISVFTLGRRLLRPGEAWIATGIMLGIPAVPFIFVLPYSDMSWALYAFLSLYALILWKQREQPVLLVLSGIMAGLAAGSKYTGLSWTVALGAIIAISHLRPPRKGLIAAILFGTTALAVASPWYIKNWWQSGNLFFPMIFGGPGWGTLRLDILNAYLKSYGVGNSVLDFILLPWNIYFRSRDFTGFSIEVPSLLFPLGFLYLLFRREKSLHLLFVSGLVYTAFWFTGSQQARHLILIYPIFSILSAVSFSEIVNRGLPRLKSSIISGILLGLLLSTLIYQLAITLQYLTILPVFGLESKQTFLERNVHDYGAMRYIIEKLSSSDRVFMMWDGQGYYCDQRCIPDYDQSQWVRLIYDRPGEQDIASRLREKGVTHLLYSHGDVYWFWYFHDPTGQHSQAVEYFILEFRPACTREVYTDEYAIIYELTCP